MRYTLVINDDYSHFTLVIFLKSKDQTASQIIKMFKRLFNQKSSKIEKNRSDKGSEFVNQTLSSFLEHYGIKHEFSEAKTTQQNGVAERKNRTLKEAARTMLADSKVSQSKAYWVFNKRTLNVEESVHVIFDEDLTTNITPNAHQISDLFQEIQLDNDSEDESEDEFSPPIRTFQSPEPELVDPAVEDHNIDQPVDIHQTHTVENNEEQHHETQEHQSHIEGTEPNQDNLTDQDLEAHVNNENQPNDRRKWSKKHPLSAVIGNPIKPLRTQGKMIKEFLHATFISQEEPKKIEDALADSCWIESMQEELNQFTRNSVWDLVPRPSHQLVIGTRWVFRNKLNEEGTVVRNKSRLVAQGYRQEEELIMMKLMHQ
ncbi:uncharacterized protein [Henckelia pumila]|uniref:uncharacterized protein n=1 Tax=Henckelia pumila TaxID=405737 RepID=UPI003C6E98EA